MTRTYTIRELANEFGVTTRTIRFYEDEGLLAPLRDGRRRIYRPRDRTRLKLILRGRRLGFSLAEVKEIIDLYDAPPGEAGQLAFLLDRIAARRAGLEAKRRDIEASLRDLDAVAENCRKRLEHLKSDGEPASEEARRAKARP
ncbi:MAG: MerR family DNA-binding transcriptional regulator [Kiloniellaceae bacterium]